MGTNLKADLKPAATRTARHASITEYGPLATLFYDADKPIAAEEEVAWYRSRLPKDAGALLEAMAGSGRVLVPLTEAGFRVHGVDLSEAMLASCAARLRGGGYEASLFRQNIAALNVPFRYGAAFIAAGSLQLLTAQSDVLEALGRIRAHLVPPGGAVARLVRAGRRTASAGRACCRVSQGRPGRRIADRAPLRDCMRTRAATRLRRQPLRTQSVRADRGSRGRDSWRQRGTRRMKSSHWCAGPATATCGSKRLRRRAAMGAALRNQRARLNNSRLATAATPIGDIIGATVRPRGRRIDLPAPRTAATA